MGSHPYLVINYNAGAKKQAYDSIRDENNEYYYFYNTIDKEDIIVTDGEFHYEVIILDRENKKIIKCWLNLANGWNSYQFRDKTH